MDNHGTNQENVLNPFIRDIRVGLLIVCAQLTKIFRDLFDGDTLVLTPELTAAEVSEGPPSTTSTSSSRSRAASKSSSTPPQLGWLYTVGHLASLIATKLVAQGR
jgi:hypothetical protein